MFMNVVIPANTRFSYPIAGGLGAQVFGAATAFYLRELGNAVNVDLTYFDHPPLTALEGAKGIPSIWSWELDKLGVDKREVGGCATNERGEEVTPNLGWLSAVGSLALQDSRVVSRFSIPSIQQLESVLQLSGRLSDTYTAVHLRRGDYLNCSSFVVPSAAAYDCACRASRYTRHLVIVSDSSVDQVDLRYLRTKFRSIDIVADKSVSPAILWALFTYATVLVSGNSQFSLSAGYFSRGVVFAPDQYFGREDSISNTIYEQVSPFFLYKSVRQESRDLNREGSLVGVAS